MKINSILSLLLIGGLALVLSSCGGNKTAGAVSDADSLENVVADTAVYGRCDVSTTMNVLHLVTDENKDMEFVIDNDSMTIVQGGLLSGDRMMVTFHSSDDGLVADKIVNITSLFGRWTSIDRNFEIMEDGNVKSAVSAESKPYTAWATVNANLILNTDTFAILSLGADSLELENANGVFVYKRQK